MSTATEVSKIGWQPFYWLKISGLPYYFFATVDPTSSRFGSFAWTLPAGYSAKRGMEVPDDTIEQSLPDLVGGIASASRCRLKLLDIDQFDANGPYKLFGRLVAPGRVRNVAAITWGFLEGDLDASASTGDTFEVRGATAFPAAPSTAYIGQESITYSAISGISGGVQTLTIDARQKFPCVDNWNSKTWPPPQLYRVEKDAGGATLPSANIPVASDLVNLMGRTAALYCGHIDPNGTPVAEEDGVLLIAGRLKSFEYARGAWLAELESVTADLLSAAVAPHLEHAEIASNQIIVPSYVPLQTFLLGLVHQDTHGIRLTGEVAIQVAAGNYSLEVLIAKINKAISDVTTPTGPWGSLKTVRCDANVGVAGDGRRVQFTRSYGYGGIGYQFSDVSENFYVRHGYDTTAEGFADLRQTGARHDQSLLSLLGFSDSQNAFEAVDPATTAGLHPNTNYNQILFSDLPAPWIAFAFTGFVPVELALVGHDAPGSRFFTDQGDGSGQAWAKLDSGAIVRVTANTAGTVSIDTGGSLPPRKGALAGDVSFYFVEAGGSASIEQVIIAPDNWIQSPSAARLVGQFMASDSHGSAADDFNIYPPGVGLGLGALMDKPSWRIGDSVGARRIFVDRDTTLADMLTPICKEMGFFIVWDPVAGAITLRQARMPSAVGASTLVFSDSNRAAATDVTDATLDFSSMRTGWSVQIGWDAAQQKFVGPTVKIMNYFPLNEYGIAAKDEKIADKSLELTDQIGAVLDELLSKRGKFYENPWMRMKRTAQKGAIFMAPGSIHQIVDALIHNPYTGAFGITSADEIYGLLTKVAIVPATGLVNVELVIQGREPQHKIRRVAPNALVDIDANSGGYASGYSVGPPDLVKVVRHYTQNDDGAVFDGIDFEVGDNVRLTTLDNDGAPAFTFSDTIAAIDALGQVVTLTTGGWFGSGWSTYAGQIIMVGETYGNATAAQILSNPFLGAATDGTVSTSIQNFIWG